MKKQALIVLYIAFAALIFGQSVRIYAPYVSGIRAIPDGNSIILSWKSSPDIEGDLHIYRYTREIKQENFRSAQAIARIPASRSEFRDMPPESGSYYYLVLATDSDGQILQFFIPFRNATTLAVTVQIDEEPIPLRAEVSHIQAEIDQDAVQLSFSASRSDRQLVIHRHTSPIGDLETIIEATRVGSISSALGAYRDYPIPGISYYYSIVDAESLLDGSAEFVFGRNSISRGVRLTADQPLALREDSATAFRRRRPLPFLLLSSEISTGRSIRDSIGMLTPEPQELSPPVREVVESIVSSVSLYRAKIQRPDILIPDRITESSPDILTLGSIIESSLLNGDYQKGVEKLDAFLSLRRPREVQFRARYYLGQCYYFMGEYRKAFMEFIIAQEGYYAAAKPWIDDIFIRMRMESS